MGEIYTVLSGIGQKGVNDRLRTEKGGDAFMQLFINEKEALELIRAIELYMVDTQSDEAQKLLNRIYTCIEKQGRAKTTH